MCPTLPASEFGSDAFNADAFYVVSIAYRLAGAIRNARTSMRFSKDLWELDKTIKILQDRFYGPPETPPSPVAKEQVESGIRAIKSLQASFAHLVSNMKAAGLYNQSRISGPLISAMERIDDIADFAYVVEVNSDTEESAAIDRVFDDALEELRRGETVPGESIF